MGSRSVSEPDSVAGSTDRERLLTEADVEEPDVEAPAGGRGEREEREDWDGDGVLRRIDESLLRACMRWRSGGR